MVEGEGYWVATAAHGAEALEQAMRLPAVERMPVQAFLGKPFDLHRARATVLTILGENPPSAFVPIAERVVFRNPWA